MYICDITKIDIKEIERTDIISSKIKINNVVD